MQSRNDTITITKLGLTVALIVAFGLFVRLFVLDRMAFHHDESIHAYYSYQLYTGDVDRYKYDPTYHGPFLYHYGALFFLLFGDNDFTARLPFVSFGILMLYFVWRLRPYIGTTSAIFALLLVSISPTLTYFSRFARNDVYMGAMAMGILVFGLDYLHTRKNSKLLWMTFFLALMYTCKENSYMTGFILGSYIVFYGIYYLLREGWKNKPYPEESPNPLSLTSIRHQLQGSKNALYKIFVERNPFVKVLSLYAVFSCAAFSLVYYVSHQEAFKDRSNQLRGTADHFNINVLRTTWDEFLAQHGKIIPLWVISSLIAVALLFTLFAVIQRWSRTKKPQDSLIKRIARNNGTVLGCLFIFFALYSVLFTTMGNNPVGMKSGTVDYLLYWMGQQFEPRITGAPDYFLPRLIIYELLPVIFGVLAFVIYILCGLGWVYGIAMLIAIQGVVAVYWSILHDASPTAFNTYLYLFLSLCIAGVIVVSKYLITSFSFVPPGFEEEKPEASQKPESSLRPDGLRIFLIYWTLLSVLIYAMLEEKVPWLLVHQALPLAILAGTFLGDLWKRLNINALRVILAIIIGVLAVYEVRTTMLLNFYRSDDPRETLVYTQSDHGVKHIAEEMIEGAQKLGAEYCPPTPEDRKKTLAALQGTAQWPYYWYLRHYKVVPTSNVPREGIPYVIVDDNANIVERMKGWSDGKYIRRKVPHRVWWAYETKNLSSFKVIFPFDYYRNQSQDKVWGALWNYVLYREVWGNLGSTNVNFYAKQPLHEPVGAPEVPEGFNNPMINLNVMEMIGTQGSEPGQFREPRGVTLSTDEGTLYVLDALNGRVQAFDTETLEYQGYFGGPGNESGHFEVSMHGGPNGGIDVAPDGSIYITDTWWQQFGRIHHFGPNGDFLKSLRPTGNEYFYSPRGLTVASDGSLYVSDTGNHRIVKFSPEGEFQGAVVKGDLNEPVGITMGPDGLLYVCDVGGRRVAAYRQNGQFVRQWNVYGWRSTEDLPMQFIEPYVAVDNRRNVYVTDSTADAIYRFGPSENDIQRAGGSGTQPGKFRRPKGITVDSNGVLYIADSRNHRIVKARFP